MEAEENVVQAAAVTSRLMFHVDRREVLRDLPAYHADATSDLVRFKRAFPITAVMLLDWDTIISSVRNLIPVDLHASPVTSIVLNKITLGGQQIQGTTQVFASPENEAFGMSLVQQANAKRTHLTIVLSGMHAERNDISPLEEVLDPEVLDEIVLDGVFGGNKSAISGILGSGVSWHDRLAMELYDGQNFVPRSVVGFGRSSTQAIKEPERRLDQASARIPFVNYAVKYQLSIVVPMAKEKDREKRREYQAKKRLEKKEQQGPVVIEAPKKAKKPVKNTKEFTREHARETMIPYVTEYKMATVPMESVERARGTFAMTGVTSGSYTHYEQASNDWPQLEDAIAITEWMLNGMGTIDPDTYVECLEHALVTECQRAMVVANKPCVAELVLVVGQGTTITMNTELQVSKFEHTSYQTARRMMQLSLDANVTAGHPYISIANDAPGTAYAMPAKKLRGDTALDKWILTSPSSYLPFLAPPLYNASSELPMELQHALENRYMRYVQLRDTSTFARVYEKKQPPRKRKRSPSSKMVVPRGAKSDVVMRNVPLMPPQDEAPDYQPPVDENAFDMLDEPRSQMTTAQDVAYQQEWPASFNLDDAAVANINESYSPLPFDDFAVQDTDFPASESALNMVNTSFDHNEEHAIFREAYESSPKRARYENTEVRAPEQLPIDGTTGDMFEGDVDDDDVFEQLFGGGGGDNNDDDTDENRMFYLTRLDGAYDRHGPVFSSTLPHKDTRIVYKPTVHRTMAHMLALFANQATWVVDEATGHLVIGGPFHYLLAGAQPADYRDPWIRSANPHMAGADWDDYRVEIVLRSGGAAGESFAAHVSPKHVAYSVHLHNVTTIAPPLDMNLAKASLHVNVRQWSDQRVLMDGPGLYLRRANELLPQQTLARAVNEMADMSHSTWRVVQPVWRSMRMPRLAWAIDHSKRQLVVSRVYPLGPRSQFVLSGLWTAAMQIVPAQLIALLRRRLDDDDYALLDFYSITNLRTEIDTDALIEAEAPLVHMDLGTL